MEFEKSIDYVLMYFHPSKPKLRLVCGLFTIDPIMTPRSISVAVTEIV